eukprot:15017165-Heterocapsa_arctica.AAC.1
METGRVRSPAVQWEHMYARMWRKSFHALTSWSMSSLVTVLGMTLSHQEAPWAAHAVPSVVALAMTWATIWSAEGKSGRRRPMLAMIPRLRKTTSSQRRCGDWQAMTCSRAVVSEALARS